MMTKLATKLMTKLMMKQAPSLALSEKARPKPG